MTTCQAIPTKTVNIPIKQPKAFPTDRTFYEFRDMLRADAQVVGWQNKAEKCTAHGFKQTDCWESESLFLHMADIQGWQ